MENASRYSPMLLKLSDKVLLNFFILPIFSTGWEAGSRSHISFLLTDFGSGLAAGLAAI